MYQSPGLMLSLWKLYLHKNTGYGVQRPPRCSSFWYGANLAFSSCCPTETSFIKGAQWLFITQSKQQKNKLLWSSGFWCKILSGFPGTQLLMRHLCCLLKNLPAASTCALCKLFWVWLDTVFLGREITDISRGKTSNVNPLQVVPSLIILAVWLSQQNRVLCCCQQAGGVRQRFGTSA